MTRPVRTEDTESGKYDLVVRVTDQSKPQPHYTNVCGRQPPVKSIQAGSLDSPAGGCERQRSSV